MFNKEVSFGTIPLRKKNNIWEVFLVRLKSGNHLGFPKGHKNLNETPFDTAKRELKEETNLDIKKVLSKTALVENYKIKKDSKIIDKKVSYYIVEVEGDIKLQKDEILEGFFVDINKAKDLITYENSKKIILEVLDFLKNI